jgi:7-cyano-7-deazaguanine synthase in queuosine biosynthesis
MEKIKGPICHTEVGERNFKETYVSPYNNKEHKCNECPNCDVRWWELLEMSPHKEGDLEEKMLKFESKISEWRNKSDNNKTK